MTHSDISQRLELARQIGVEAGKQTLKLFQNRELQVDRKNDSSPVTEADRNAETFLRNEIEKVFPDDGIVGEEHGVKEGKNSVRWILDPIDGTKSFISGVPLYGTMVGVEIDGRPEIGVVYIPGLDEGVFASTGNGAWHFKGEDPPTQCAVSQTSELSEAVIVTSEISTFGDRNAGQVYEQLVEQAYFVRTWGDCYGYVLVATGRVDLMIDPILSVWDAAAVSPIISEAGGVFVDWSGESRIDAGEAFGTSPQLADKILDITRPFAGKFN